MIPEMNIVTAKADDSACQMISLEGIWKDFYEQIRKLAGNGIIVKIQHSSGQEKYTVVDSEPNMQDKLWIMFAYDFAQCCITAKSEAAQVDANIAGQLMHGELSDATRGSGKALRKMLERFSGGINLTVLEQERDYIEAVIKKTFAVKLFRNRTQSNSYDLRKEDLGGITVSEEDYHALCEKLFTVLTDQYVRTYAEDERYSWLFKGRTIEDSRQITRYLVALLCVALMGIETYYKSAKVVHAIEENKAALKKNILAFLDTSDPKPEQQSAPIQNKHPRKQKEYAGETPNTYGLTREEYEDRKAVQQAVLSIKRAFPSLSVSASDLYQELASNILESVKATFYDLWDQLERSQKAYEIIEAYVDQQVIDLSKSIAKT